MYRLVLHMYTLTPRTRYHLPPHHLTHSIDPTHGSLRIRECAEREILYLQDISLFNIFVCVCFLLLFVHFHAFNSTQCRFRAFFLFWFICVRSMSPENKLLLMFRHVFFSSSFFHLIFIWFCRRAGGAKMTLPVVVMWINGTQSLSRNRIQMRSIILSPMPNWTWLPFRMSTIRMVHIQVLNRIKACTHGKALTKITR